MPCTSRSATSSTTAARPIEWYDGSRPISVVATPISSSVMTRLCLRPTRSPRWPNSTAPTGRAKKPMAKVPSEASVPMKGSLVAKNTSPNTRAAAVA
jgi:hypothetical protein